MKVLIVGGTGLISTAITDQLVARGDEVSVFNRGVTERRITKDVATIKGDRWDYPAFERAFDGHSFDAVIDMFAFLPEDAQALVRTFWGRAKQVVVCSTVCAYGGPLTKVPATDDEPHRPVTGYGRNKSAIERTLLENDARQGTRATVLRPSYTIGEGATAGGVLFDDSTPERIRRGLPVIVHGDGTTKWATAHASDVARGFVNSLLNERAFGQAYHLTSDEHTTWNGVFEELGKALGKRPIIEHVPVDWLYAAAPRRTIGPKFIYQYDSIFDNSKAARDLGFKTTVPLVETFRRQVAWMDKSGKTKKVEDEPFEDLLLAAYKQGTTPKLPEGMDANPWGNQPTM